jgi:translation initiation factor IF-2
MVELSADAPAVTFKPPISIRKLAEKLGCKPFELIANLVGMGVFANDNQNLEESVAIRLCASHGFRFEEEKRAKGKVIAASLELARPVITVVVSEGTLQVGDILSCGQFYGEVRELLDMEGNRQNEAGPSAVVKVLGLNGAPEVGLEFHVVDNEEEALRAQVL